MTPSDWYVSQLVMERQSYQDALRGATEARKGYRQALRRALAAGWSLRALEARTGWDRRQLGRDAKKGLDATEAPA